MVFVLLMALVLASTLFESSIERAFTAIKSNEWLAAAAALDQASSVDPGGFDANNFHYLRGRVAEGQKDWARAKTEFSKVTKDNPLYFQAMWHAARASAQLREDDAAEEFLDLLPGSFPASLKLEIAREASARVASTIYEGLSTREARYQQAKLSGDIDALWTLLRQKNDDDAGLDAARRLAASAQSAKDLQVVAQTFVAHREFEAALPLYRKLAEDPAHAPDARYQIARIHFFNESYELALEDYRKIASDYAGTDWEKDAEYQIASCYWRLGEYRSAAAAYLDYIDKYGKRQTEEGAIRNLIDVYRVLNENQKALDLIDRTLAKQLTTATRQVLLFSKAKILYTQKRYAPALTIFQQLGRATLRTTSGGTTADEVQFFQAMCLSKLGNKTGAEAIWRRLARDEFSYYGQRATEQLGRQTGKAPPACTTGTSAVSEKVEAEISSLRRPLRTDKDPAADAVSELMFLRLWDEAFFWSEESGKRPTPRTAALMAFMAGQYNRSISYANRLPKAGSTLPLFYPAGFRELLCAEAAKYNADPLWLHAIIWQESKYNPLARSSAAARGLMQFIPQTAAGVAASIGLPSFSVEQLYDPAVNIALGARYWSVLMEEWAKPELALAAYNGGSVNVRRWKNKWPDAPDDIELFVADIGFVETKRYVMAVFEARAAYGALE